MKLDFKVLRGLLEEVVGRGSKDMGGASTWENFSRLHSWSSPGWCPGKSVDVTFVTVSALTPTIFMRVS